MNAFIRQKYARYSFGRFSAVAASNDTDVLALSILPNQSPLHWWTQRLINTDSRRCFSDQPIEVQYHCHKPTTTHNMRHRHKHTPFSHHQFSSQKNIFFFSHLLCLLRNWTKNRITERLHSVRFACVIIVMMQPTSTKRTNRTYDFYDLYLKPEWVPVMNEL